MEDGAPGHRAKSTKEWHQRHGIQLFPGWSGNSPDLNPIENLWSQVKNLQRLEQATSLAGIIKVAKKVQRAITPEYLENLYESMLRRMAAVIAAGVRRTKYQSSSEQSNCIILINKWTFTQGGAIFFRKIVLVHRSIQDAWIHIGSMDPKLIH